MQVDPSHLEIHRTESVLVGSSKASIVQRKMHMQRLQMKSAFLQMLMKLVQYSWLSTVDRFPKLENSRSLMSQKSQASIKTTLVGASPHHGKTLIMMEIKTSMLPMTTEETTFTKMIMEFLKT